MTRKKASSSHSHMYISVHAKTVWGDVQSQGRWNSCLKTPRFSSSFCRGTRDLTDRKGWQGRLKFTWVRPIFQGKRDSFTIFLSQTGQGHEIFYEDFGNRWLGNPRHAQAQKGVGEYPRA